MNKKNTFRPLQLGGFGVRNFGKQYRQGNRGYNSCNIAVCLVASSIGSMGGYSYLYLVKK